MKSTKFKNGFLNFFLVFCLTLNLTLPIAVLADENIEQSATSTTETVTDENTDTSQDQNVEEEIVDEDSQTEDTETEDGETNEDENNATTTEETNISETFSLLSIEPEVETKTVHLHIRNGGDIVYEDDVVVETGQNIDVIDNTETTHSIASDSVLAVLEYADAVSDDFDISDLAYYSSFDSFLLNCIDIGAESPESKCYNWQFVVDGEYPQVGMNSYTVSDGSDVYIYFGNPKRVTAETSPIISNGIFYAKAEKYSYTDDSWDPISGTVVGMFYADPGDPWTNIEVSTSTTDSFGRAILTAGESGDFSLGIQSDYYYPATSVTVEDAGERIVTLLRVRNGDDLVFDDVVVMPSDGKVTITDSSLVDTEVAQNSVLGLLDTASKSGDSFSISNLVYYPSFGSFLINCVDVTGDELCYNWQYAVNNDYASMGTNQYLLENRDKVYFYFGSSRRLEVPASVTVGQSFDVLAEKYDYTNNSWLPLTGVTIGETVPDLSNPYSPTELATSTVDADGRATFIINKVGDYNFGIQDDYYYPLYSVSIVEEAADTTTNTGGGSGGSERTPDKDAMMTYLDSNQKSNGSFGADLYTDWVAMAYGSTSGHGDAKSKLKTYLKTDHLDGTSATDYERRAMALMALNINPYTGGDENYIAKIVSKFDGEQFGESDLFNDDVFAIIALRSAGYSSSDEIITKARDAIISNLKTDSFGSVDLAAATIQALNLVDKTSESESVITSAKNYILGAKDASGGFGNISSSSWAMQALPLVSVSIDSTMLYYVYDLQQDDGGVKDETTGDDINSRVWATSYAVVAIQSKTWHSIMSSFALGDVTPTESDTSSGGSSDDDSVVAEEEVVSTTTPVVVNTIAPQVVPSNENSNSISPDVDTDLDRSNTEATSTATTTEDIDISNIASPSGSGVLTNLFGQGFAFISGIFMIIGQWIKSLWI